MSKIGIKIVSSNEMAKCVKIVREYQEFSISQIKNSILNNEYVVEGNYTNDKDIALLLRIYNELIENKINAELYEHDRKTNVRFFNNLVEMYNGINTEINNRIDKEIE